MYLREEYRRLENAYPRTARVTSGYRFYSPELGRWSSRDPIRERGGKNLYVMVMNRLISMIDPYGLAATECSAAEKQSLQTDFYKAIGFASAATPKELWQNRIEDSLCFINTSKDEAFTVGYSMTCNDDRLYSSLWTFAWLCAVSSIDQHRL